MTNRLIHKHFVMWKCVLCLTLLQVNPILVSPFRHFGNRTTAPQSRQPPSRVIMAHVRTGKARALLRSSPSGSFDQYLLDIQKLPMITDPEEEKRLARRALAGDEDRRRAAGHGEPPVRDLLREEVPGPRPRSLRAGGDRERRAAQGGAEVRSRPRRQVHLLCGVVGASGGAQGAGRADPERADPAQPELRAGANGAGAELPGPGAGPRADRRGRSPSRSTTRWTTSAPPGG